MIPFASQRGGGQDLATHLMNAHDNEEIELFQVRGAIARDLHGAFAEWKALARALTRARQYLCSLSVNPDELQGRLTRAQYVDYIERAEERLGLTGQPRAIIFHVKADERGRTREHCHVVWSRTDVTGKRAVPLSFFKEKMMTVTREFARDHGLELPDGYRRQEDKLRRRNRQLSGYDCIKQKETGISHEERMAAVTGAWQRSDNGTAFVNALEDLGYILARGRNKTRVVLIDFYGHTTALTRLIDDPAVRARDVREFLGAHHAPEKLPIVEQAQEYAAQRRKAIEAFEKARREGEQVGQLLSRQAARREELEAQASVLRRQQHDERVQIAADQSADRQALKAAYLAAQKRVRAERARREPKGLAAFLGRWSGIALVTKKVQRYRDRKRYGAYLAGRETLKRRQQHERQVLACRHELQAADIRRKLRALDQVEQRERQSFDIAARNERRQQINARHRHMPALALNRKAIGQKTAAGKTKKSDTSPLARELAEAARQLKTDGRQINLADVFARASGGGESEQGDQGDSGGLRPKAKRERKDRDRPPGGLVRAFRRAASDNQDEGETGGSRSDGPKPAAEQKTRRRRKERPARKAEKAPPDVPDEAEERKSERDQERKRKRRRDFDRGM